MNDSVAVAARAAARRLEAETRAGLTAEVEVALAARESGAAPRQYVDPVSMGSLIVAIASLAWTIYKDLRKRTAHPSPDVVARTVRVRLQDDGQAAPDHVVEVVVTEAIRTAADSSSAHDQQA
jgi:hypothetical protein